LEKYGKEPLQWNEQMTRLVWRLHPDNAVTAIRQRALSPSLSLEQRRYALTTLAFIPTKEAAAAMQEIEGQAAPKEVADIASWWLRFRSGNDWAGFYQTDKKQEELSEQVKSWRSQLTRAASTPEEKIAAATGLAQDPAGGKILIQLAAGKWLTPELSALVAEHIFSNPDQSVRVLAGEYFKSANVRTYDIQQILRLKADARKGEEVFAAYCASCHRVGSAGNDIGPELSHIRNKLDRRALLDAVIHPNADIVFGYEPWMIHTKNSGTVYGFLQSEGEYIVIRDATGQQINIPAKDIVSRERARSLMPDPATLGLQEQHLADIAAYLMTL